MPEAPNRMVLITIKVKIVLIVNVLFAMTSRIGETRKISD